MKNLKNTRSDPNAISAKKKKRTPEIKNGEKNSDTWEMVMIITKETFIALPLRFFITATNGWHINAPFLFVYTQ